MRLIRPLLGDPVGDRPEDSKMGFRAEDMPSSSSRAGGVTAVGAAHDALPVYCSFGGILPRRQLGICKPTPRVQAMRPFRTARP